MKPRIDLTGKRFHHLTVIEEAQGYHSKCGHHRRRWLCRCDCGNYTVVNQQSLYRKDHPTTSCGCTSEFWKKRPPRVRTEPDGKRERLYTIWTSMKNRCYVKTNNEYQHYGGRGIKICDEWRTSYATFRKWALDNGYDSNAQRGKCTIDRINHDDDYCPTNCRWVDMVEQNNNKRNTVKYNYNGIKYTTRDIANMSGLPYGCVRQRLEAGWGVSEILVIPYGMKRRQYYAKQERCNQVG